MKETFEGQTVEEEDWRLEPLEPEELLEQREAVEDPDVEEQRHAPEEEAAEADCLPPFAKDRFFSTAKLQSSFTWVNDSFTDAWVEAGR